MAKKKTPPPKVKSERRGRPPLPQGTVQLRVTLPPNTLPWFTEGAEKAGMSVPAFIGLSARHGFKSALNATLGIKEAA